MQLHPAKHLQPTNFPGYGNDEGSEEGEMIWFIAGVLCAPFLASGLVSYIYWKEGPSA